MTDASLRGLHLSVYAFSDSQCTLLINALTLKWGLACMSIILSQVLGSTSHNHLWILYDFLLRNTWILQCITRSVYNILDLLPFYAILRSIPNKLFGVLAMFAALLILLGMPLFDTSRVRGAQFRPMYRAAFWVLVLDFYILMQLGAHHVENPFIFLGQIATAIYFAWFVLLVPLLGVIENTLMDVATTSVENT
jgi:hypothetical protein